MFLGLSILEVWALCPFCFLLVCIFSLVFNSVSVPPGLGCIVWMIFFVWTGRDPDPPALVFFFFLNLCVFPFFFLFLAVWGRNCFRWGGWGGVGGKPLVFFVV